MATENLQRTIAKLKRDLTELRSRMGRIEGETFSAKREIAEIEAELGKVVSDGGAV